MRCQEVYIPFSRSHNRGKSPANAELNHAILTPTKPLSIPAPVAANTRPKRQWNPSSKSLENFARITIEELCFRTYDEPRTEKEAMEGNEWEYWKSAMESENEIDLCE